MLTKELTDKVQPMIEEIYNDDFIQGMIHGTVDKNAIVHYLQADALYLKEFANLYAMLIKRTDSKPMAEFLLSQKEFSLGGESEAHAVLTGYADEKYEEIIEDGSWFPSADHYIKHLYYNAFTKSNPVFTLSAMAPCPYVYKKIADMAVGRNKFSNDHPFKGWFDFYHNDMGASIDELFSIIDKEAASLSGEDREQIRNNFLESTEHEQRFFSMAAKTEKWRLK